MPARLGMLTECRIVLVGGRSICLAHLPTLMEDDECVWRTLPGRGPVCISPGHQEHGEGAKPLSAEAQAWLKEIEQHPEIIKGKTLIKGISTDEIHMNADGTWKEERVKEYHEPIVASILNPNAVPDPGEPPTLVLYAGAGGSGKTTALGEYLPYGGGKEAMQRFTVINADDIKDRLPEYTGYNAALVHEESAYIAETLAFRAAARARQNILFDGTGKTAAKYLEMARDMRAAGYRVILMYSSVDPLTSTQRAVGRFLRMVETGAAKPRFVDPGYLLRVVDAKPDKTYTAMKASGLIDRAVKVDNNGTKPRLVEDVQLRRTAESAHRSGRLSRASRSGERPDHPRGMGGETARADLLSEADDCRWVTVSGAHICITKGHGGHPRGMRPRGSRFASDAERLKSNARWVETKKKSDAERLKGHAGFRETHKKKSDADRVKGNVGWRLVHEARGSDECNWVTIGGNHICITPGHTRGGFASYEKGRKGQPQYYHGGRRVPPATPEAQQFAMLDRLLAPDGGFTYDPKTNSEPTTGFALSIHPDRSKVLDATTLTKEDLVKYTIDNWDLLSEAGNHLGAWHDPKTGQVFLDISTVVSSAAEASRLALAHDQIAYFDLTAQKSVDVNRAAKSGQKIA